MKFCLTLLHSEWPKLHIVLAILGPKGLRLCAQIKAYESFRNSENADFVISLFAIG